MGEPDNTYLVHTESSSLMFDQIKDRGFKPSRILSVVGSGWPSDFQSQFPESEVNSFDMNREQIKVFRQGIKDSTKNEPSIVKVPDYGFEDVLSETDPDLLFLSNIPDYLKKDEIVDLCEILDEYEIKMIIFSSLGDNLAVHGGIGNAESLAEQLEDIEYQVTKHKSNSFEVGDLYIATLKQ